jgi:hypothetical protein
MDRQEVFALTYTCNEDGERFYNHLIRFRCLHIVVNKLVEHVYKKFFLFGVAFLAIWLRLLRVVLEQI